MDSPRANGHRQAAASAAERSVFDVIEWRMAAQEVDDCCGDRARGY